MTCDRRIGPYPCCSVVQGDCLLLMRDLPDGCVDAVITDPPYGIGADEAAHKNKGKWGWKFYGETAWDRDRPSAEVFSLLLRKGKRAVIWGGNYFTDFLVPSMGWLIWDKGQRDFSLADFEMAWTSIHQAARIFDYPRALALQDGKEHPTQKPLALMSWCIARAGNPDTILDPFCGSGTTLVAAKKLGRHFLGFEISPEYCEISRRRLAEIDAQPTLFEPKPEQLSL